MSTSFTESLRQARLTHSVAQLHEALSNARKLQKTASHLAGRRQKTRSRTAKALVMEYEVIVLAHKLEGLIESAKTGGGRRVHLQAIRARRALHNHADIDTRPARLVIRHRFGEQMNELENVMEGMTVFSGEHMGKQE